MMRVAVAIIVVLLSAVGSGPRGPVPAVHAQPPTWSAHCHITDGTMVFIENGVPKGPATGPEPYRVSTIEGMKGQAGFGPSPNCPTNHVMAEFQIPLSAAGGDSYSPDPLYWSASVPDQPPIASFISSPAQPVASQNVVFVASWSYDPDGTVVSYYWNFVTGMAGSGEFLAYAVESPGMYTV